MHRTSQYTEAERERDIGIYIYLYCICIIWKKTFLRGMPMPQRETCTHSILYYIGTVEEEEGFDSR